MLDFTYAEGAKTACRKHLNNYKNGNRKFIKSFLKKRKNKKK